MSDKTALATAFLANAPAGEYEQCSAALTDITNDPAIVSAAREESLLAWDRAQCTCVTLGDHMVIVCDEALLPDGRYLDPHTQEAFTYDYKSKMVAATGDKIETSPLRTAIHARLAAYAPLAYTAKSGYGAYDKDDSVVVVMTSKSISLKNYRTGSATGKYVIAKDGTYTGRIETQQHFFENGNALCQFGADAKGKVRVSSEDPEKFADFLVDSIAEFEERYFEAFCEGLEKIGEEGLNKLRRKLPVTATKINWEMELTTGGGMQKSKK